jgi:hypothetical protein
MARTARKSSPTLALNIGEEQFDRAVKSDSGRCLIADAIRAQYPHLTKIWVDMATIRVTDTKRGQRFTYLTTPAAQFLLLSFDQGWPKPPTDQLTIRGAVQIRSILRYRARASEVRERGEARLAELKAKQAAGETLTKGERIAYTKLTNHRPAPERPASQGPREVSERDGHVTIHGGRGLPAGPAHPNLLRNQDRHYGAKLADPGVAFREAVDKAVAERLAAEPAS